MLWKNSFSFTMLCNDRFHNCTILYKFEKVNAQCYTILYHLHTSRDPSDLETSHQLARKLPQSDSPKTCLFTRGIYKPRPGPVAQLYEALYHLANILQTRSCMVTTSTDPLTRKIQLSHCQTTSSFTWSNRYLFQQQPTWKTLDSVFIGSPVNCISIKFNVRTYSLIATTVLLGIK